MGSTRQQAASRKPGRRVSITRRDVAVMELLVERRAETLDELAERFFAERSRKRARNRLGQLASAGYLQRTKVLVPSYDEPQNVYTVGPKGKRALELRSPTAVELFADRRFNPTLRTASLPHQIASNRVADRLGIRMTPEHLLSRRREAAAVRPDRVYRAGDLPDFRPEVWVEVDLGDYSRRRIQEKVEAAVRLQEHTVRGMVFVCVTTKRARQLEGWLGTPRYPAMRVEFAVLTVDELSLEALDPWLRPGAEDNGDLPDLSAWRAGA